MTTTELFTNVGSYSFYPGHGLAFHYIIEKIAKGCHLQMTIKNRGNTNDGRVKYTFEVTGTEEDIRNFRGIVRDLADLLPQE